MKNRILLISLAVMLALSMDLVGCGGGDIPEYSLTISSTEGGSVTSPGEETSTYDEGQVVNLLAAADEGYQFVSWTGDVGEIADVEDSTTLITMKGDYSITATFAVRQYSLVIHSTEGGSVTTPGENAYTYDKGDVVSLVAQPDEGYQFTGWTGGVSTIADVNAPTTTITMDRGYSITANFAKEIWDWYDLDTIRSNLDGGYILMNDLDSNTPGYTELASPTANQGQGWEPIGSLLVDPSCFYIIISAVDPFRGSLDGQGYEIRDMFINRSDEAGVGLFGSIGGGGLISNLGTMDVDVAGRWYVGGLVGQNHEGTVNNARSTGSVAGDQGAGGLAGGNSHTISNSHFTGNVACGGGPVGGLVGQNRGMVSGSYSSGSVTGGAPVGGLVGMSSGGTVSDSYSTGTVAGGGNVGGLVGWNGGTVSNSYSTGSVSGEWSVGGLVGRNTEGTVTNSHYDYEEVSINNRRVITIGALSSEDFGQWLGNDKSLDVNERLSQEDGYYLISDISDFRQLLAFGQDASLKFRLEDDLDLDAVANFYVPYLAGEFDGDGHTISNLGFSTDFVSHVGLFGYLDSVGKVAEVGVRSVNIAGFLDVGGLVGLVRGTVIDSYSDGRVAGDNSVGGLVGSIGHDQGTVTNCHYNYDDVLVNGRNVITIGALSDEDFNQWLANGRFLDINQRLTQEDGYYLINDIDDFKSLLAFGENSALRFRLTSDLDLDNEPNFYIPYLAGEFDGNGHVISNMDFSFDSASPVGLFGFLDSSGQVTRVGADNVDITGYSCIGGLVGWNRGVVDRSYSSGSVTGVNDVGGLVGCNDEGTVRNSYSISGVAGYERVGGLAGSNGRGSTSNCYSSGSVTGEIGVGGLAGENWGTVSSSFWNIQTSNQATSEGGIGKSTAEMKSIATFSGAGWNIAVVAVGEGNPSYMWNIVDGQTYPFLSWES